MAELNSYKSVCGKKKPLKYLLLTLKRKFADPCLEEELVNGVRQTKRGGARRIAEFERICQRVGRAGQGLRF